jgi:hypothetical protein
MKTFRILSLLILITALLFSFGCEDKETNVPEQNVDLTGSWELTSTVTSNTCGLQNGETLEEVIYIEDSNGALSITTFSGDWGSGAVNGQNLSFNGSDYMDDLGCYAAIETDGQGLISGNQISGTFTMTVNFDPDSCDESYNDCSISCSYTMARVEEISCLGRAVFGNPEYSDFTLPYPIGKSYTVIQSYCWQTGGHRNQLSYDFDTAIGDTIVAARGGVVREIREDSPDNGQGEGEHNYIFIQHIDETVAFYAHLMQNNVFVEPGDTVYVGQLIALSGNSGLSSGPHLHFGVYQNYHPVEGEDVPVNFSNTNGPLDERGGLIMGEVYEALPYVSPSP